jgi:hypothetical protein
LIRDYTPSVTTCRNSRDFWQTGAAERRRFR